MPYQYSCPECGQKVESGSEDELVNLSNNHMRDQHDQEVTDDYIRDNISEV